MENKDSKYNEIEIINQAKTNPKFFAPLYEKYYQEIFIFIFKKIQNEEDTSDVCSKTFTKALLNIGKYKDLGFPFSAWLYKIASNEVNLFFRFNKKIVYIQVEEQKLLNLMNETDSPISDYTEEQKYKLLEALEELPLEHSQVIEMRFFEKLSFKEISLIYGVTEASMKMKIYRILEKLKTRLQ